MKHRHKRIFPDKRWLMLLIAAIAILLFIISRQPSAVQENNPDVISPEGTRGPPNFHPSVQDQALPDDAQPAGGQ